MRIAYIGTFSRYEPGVTATEQLVLGVRSYLDGAHGALGAEGERVECLIGDDQGDPATGVREARRLVEREGVAAFVFVAASIVMEAVLEYATEAHVPIAGTGGALRPLFRPVRPWLFTARTPYESHAAALADQLLRDGARRIALVSTEDGTGRSYAAGLSGALAKSGVEPAAVALFRRLDGELGRVVQRLADAEPDVVVCTHFAPTSGALVAEARSAGLPATWAFGPSATNPETAQVAGAAAVEGCLGQSSFAAPTTESAAIRSFVADMRRQDEDAEITSLTQLGYVTARAVTDAVRSTGDRSGDGIRAALEGLAGDYGMLPPFRLSPHEHLLNRGVQLMRFAGGSLVPFGAMREVDPDTWEVREMTSGAPT